jgi:hypothetical protein
MKRRAREWIDEHASDGSEETARSPHDARAEIWQQNQAPGNLAADLAAEKANIGLSG